MKNESPPEGICRRCQKPWKDILGAKPEYGFFEHEGIEYTYHTVGSGFTKYRCTSFKTEDDWTRFRRRQIKEVSPGIFAPNVPSTEEHLDDEIASFEAEALRTLESAGIPTPPPGDETYLSEVGCRRKLLEATEERGFRECVDKEWYAAFTLLLTSQLRESLTEGREIAGARTNKATINMIAITAMMLGRHIQDANIRDIIGDYSRRGGSKEKADPVIARYVLTRLKKKPTTTVKDLLDELSALDAFSAVPIGRAKLFAERGRIKVFENGNERSIAISSFPRYITEARKRLALPSPRTLSK